MIVRTARNGDYQARDMFAGASTVPSPGARYGSATGGLRLDDDHAGAVPAATRAIRLLCETGGQLPMTVRSGMRGDPTAAPAPDSWEAGILAQPNLEQSPMDVWSYAIASLLRGGAAFLKGKDNNGRVAELYVLDPRRWYAKAENGSVVVHLKDGSTTKRLTKRDVIYVPGFLASSPSVGCSVVANHAMTLGVARALEEFEARFYANDAAPGGVITVPGNPKKEQRDELRESWEARHQGVGNAHRVGVLWGGATYDSVGISLSDAQFIEAQGFSIAQVARMYGVPLKWLTGDSDESDPEVENLRFANFSLSPWTTRLEQGLSLDRDLFPDPGRFAKMDLSQLERGTFSARATAYREARQGGWMTANEIRRPEGLPDHPDGGDLQKTPVGGAPNPGSGASAMG